VSLQCNSPVLLQQIVDQLVRRVRLRALGDGADFNK
jgi:hypothetical protein